MERKCFLWSNTPHQHKPNNYIIFKDQKPSQNLQNNNNPPLTNRRHEYETFSGISGTNHEIKTEENRRKHKYKVMPSANSLTHFHTGTIIQACWCLQNRVISPSKLFTTTSCYVLWIYFLHVLLLDSVALLPFKENIYDNVGLMHFFFIYH